MAVMVSPQRVAIIYPETDGEPMAENTVQYRYITTIHAGLDAMFGSDPNVFVAADLFWYPVEGRSDICTAPDVMIVLGRHKGDRGSYKQWEEGNIAPQVVIEILSPGNTATEMKDKRKFFDRHGVEEYYEYDPYSRTLDAWQRSGDFFRLTNVAETWKSPRLGVTFELQENGELNVYSRDGRKFLSPTEEIKRAELAESRVEQLASKLRELGINPEEING